MPAKTIRRLEGDQITRWSPPERSAPGMPTKDEQAAATGYEEGYARGLDEGRRAAEAEMRPQADQLATLCASAVAPFAALDEQVEQELVRLCLHIARQVIRRELHSDADQIAALVRESCALLGDVSAPLHIGVHPDDAALLRRMFADDEAHSSVVLDEDPSIARGGCTLATQSSFIDATVETRIARIAVQLLGDERASLRLSADAEIGEGAPPDKADFDMVLS